MKVGDMKVEWADGEVVHLTVTPGVGLAHALMAIEMFRLELYRVTGIPTPMMVRGPRESP